MVSSFCIEVLFYVQNYVIQPEGRVKSHSRGLLAQHPTLETDLEHQKKEKMCDGILWERFDLLQSQFMHRVSAAQLKHFHPLYLFPARQPADDSCGGTSNFHRCHVLLHFQTDVNFMSGGLGMPVIVLQHENDVNSHAWAFTESRRGEAADDSCKDANI